VCWLCGQVQLEELEKHQISTWRGLCSCLSCVNCTVQYCRCTVCVRVCARACVCGCVVLFVRTGYTHTQPFNGLFPGRDYPGLAGTRKVKPIWILLKQETVSGSGISWAVCKSAPRSTQTTTPAPDHSVFFTGRMPFLPPNQQHQSTEGSSC